MPIYSVFEDFNQAPPRLVVGFVSEGLTYGIPLSPQRSCSLSELSDAISAIALQLTYRGMTDGFIVCPSESVSELASIDEAQKVTYADSARARSLLRAARDQ